MPPAKPATTEPIEETDFQAKGPEEVIEDEDVPIPDSTEPIEETTDPDEPSEIRPLVKKPKMPTYAELKALPLSEICKSISDKHPRYQCWKTKVTSKFIFDSQDHCDLPKMLGTRWMTKAGRGGLSKRRCPTA